MAFADDPFDCEVVVKPAAEPKSAAQLWTEAQSLGKARELIAYCELQRQFIEKGEGHLPLRRAARLLAEEARRRRYSPETVLQAMDIVGCYRMHGGSVEQEEGQRYTLALSELLEAFNAPDTRPADRRITPR